MAAQPIIVQICQSVLKDYFTQKGQFSLYQFKLVPKVSWSFSVRKTFLELHCKCVLNHSPQTNSQTKWKQKNSSMQLVRSIPSVHKPQEPKLIWKVMISTLDLRSSSCPHSRLVVKILTFKNFFKKVLKQFPTHFSFWVEWCSAWLNLTFWWPDPFIQIIWPCAQTQKERSGQF